MANEVDVGKLTVAAEDPLIRFYGSFGFKKEVTETGVAFVDEEGYIEVYGIGTADVPKTLDEPIAVMTFNRSKTPKGHPVYDVKYDNVAELFTELCPDAVLEVHGYTLQFNVDGILIFTRDEGRCFKELIGINGELPNDYEKPCRVSSVDVNGDISINEYPSVYHAMLELHKERFENQSGMNMSVDPFPKEPTGFMHKGEHITSLMNMVDPIAEYGDSIKHFLKSGFAKTMVLEDLASIKNQFEIEKAYKKCGYALDIDLGHFYYKHDNSTEMHVSPGVYGTAMITDLSDPVTAVLWRNKYDVPEIFEFKSSVDLFEKHSEIVKKLRGSEVKSEVIHKFESLGYEVQTNHESSRQLKHRLQDDSYVLVTDGHNDTPGRKGQDITVTYYDRHGKEKTNFVVDDIEAFGKWHNALVQSFEMNGKQSPLHLLFKERGYVPMETEDGTALVKMFSDGYKIEVYGGGCDYVPFDIYDSTYVKHYADGVESGFLGSFNNPIEALYETEVSLKYIDEKREILSFAFDLKVAKVMINGGCDVNAIRDMIKENSPCVPSLSNEAREYVEKIVKGATIEMKAKKKTISAER